MKKYYITYIYGTPYAGITRTLDFESDDIDEVIKEFNAIEKGQLSFNGERFEKYWEENDVIDEEPICCGDYWWSYELYVPLEELKGKEIS